MPTLRIDVWSDIACPWCHVGKRRLEAALARFPHRDDVAVVWRSFELDPNAPATDPTPEVPFATRLARKYGSSVADAERMISRMTNTAAQDGLDFRFEKLRPSNTFDAHRLLHLAHEEGRQDQLKERLFLAYLGEGEAVGDHATLERLATEAGLDPQYTREVLERGAFSQQVRADEAEARALGVRGVPHFVFGGGHGVSGAQSVDTLLAALMTAWAEQQEQVDHAAEGAVCGPNGCG
jgi:predicted DsbA family dithiol-disulfide isomerase